MFKLSGAVHVALHHVFDVSLSACSHLISCHTPLQNEHNGAFNKYKAWYCAFKEGERSVIIVKDWSSPQYYLFHFIVNACLHAC